MPNTLNTARQSDLEITTKIVAANEELGKQTAEERLAWSVRNYRGTIVLSSSFGAQSAVMLDLVSRISPEIPILLIDTGYLFPETYQYINTLTEQLKLRVKVVRPELSPARLEERYGKLWEQGIDGIEKYNQLMKIEPFERGLAELGATAWLTGLRRSQSRSRRDLPVVTSSQGLVKIHPIIDWTNEDTQGYLSDHQLPRHPLVEDGYTSIGDHHTSRKQESGMQEEDTRFFGLKRECGLHEPK